MKAKRLLFAGLPLMLLCLTLACPERSAAQETPSSLVVLINGPNYRSAENVYIGSLSVSNPTRVRYLVYTVEDADAGTVVIGDTEVNLGGFSSRPFELDGERLTPGHRYVLKVQALDSNNNLIQRSAEDHGLSDGELFILASKEFAHQPPEAPKFDFRIDAVNADYEADALTIILTVPGGFPVLMYDGFIVDETGQRVGVIAEELYRGPELVVPLPEAIEAAAATRKYKVALKLYTRDDQQAEQVYEVTLAPPAKPGFFKRIADALVRTPLIALAIVIVISAVATAVILTRKRSRHDLPPIQRPPVDNTLASHVSVRRCRLRIRVVESPGTSRGVEKLITSFPCIIGRDEKCDICINDLTLSRKHLEIDFKDGHFFVTDLQSTNGTFIRDTQLRKGAAKSIPGAVQLRLGKQTIIELETGD